MTESPLPPETAPQAPRRGRPRSDPARAEARQRLIRTGLVHLTTRGYSATGIDEIIAGAGVSKSSFYHYFRGKADFGQQLIAAYHAYFAERLDRAFLDESLPPLDRLRAFTAEAEDGMARHAFARGCLVGNLGQEMGALPEPFRAQLTGVLENWQSRTAALLRLAQGQGALPPALDPEALATFFWIGWEGAVLRAKLERRADPLRLFTDTFFATLTP